MRVHLYRYLDPFDMYYSWAYFLYMELDLIIYTYFLYKELDLIIYTYFYRLFIIISNNSNIEDHQSEVLNLSHFSTIFKWSSTGPHSLRRGLETNPAKVHRASFTGHMFAGLLMLDHSITVNAGTIPRSLVILHFSVGSQLKSTVPRAALQESIEEDTVFIPTFVSSFPFFEAEKAKVTVLTRRADHPIRLEVAFEDLLTALGALLGKFFYPIDAQSFLELRLLFLCEDSYFLAIFKGPKGTADEVIFVRIGTPYLIFVGTDERSDQGSHGVSPNPVAATHLGHSFLLTDLVDAFRISDDVGHLSHRDLILIYNQVLPGDNVDI
jgi:hypothetical protein